MRKTLLLLLYSAASVCSALDPNITVPTVAPTAPLSTSTSPNRILFLMQSGHINSALNLYREYVAQTGHHDPDLLQHIGLALLEQGYRTREPEIQLLTLFGAGISLNEKALYILEEGLRSSQPELQLISLNFLARYNTDEANEALNRALTSNFLIIRLEGALQLAKRKAPSALGQTEALMSKVPSEIMFLFPQFYAMIGTPQATKTLRRLLAHSDEKVRVEAILNVAKFGRDDLLPTIRTLSTHHAIAQQEACAYALGVLKDEISVPKLEAMTRSACASVRLAAIQALYSLGRHEMRASLEAVAKTGDPFAVYILGEIPETNDLLYNLMQNPNLQTKINAAMALLNRKDVRCLPVIGELLIRDSRDLAIGKITTNGNALTAYKVIPSAQQNLHDNAVAIELSLGVREDALIQAMELPEKDFLQLAQMVFEKQQNDLIPVLVECLETLRTPDAIALLKREQQRAGAPLIRNYCNLALYRMKEEGPYAENLKVWVARQNQEELIRFRTWLPWDVREEDSTYELTPNETSKLLIESFETMALQQDESGITILLDTIQYGNEKNKYALTGLLMRASQ